MCIHGAGTISNPMHPECIFVYIHIFLHVCMYVCLYSTGATSSTVYSHRYLRIVFCCHLCGNHVDVFDLDVHSHRRRPRPSHHFCLRAGINMICIIYHIYVLIHCVYALDVHSCCRRPPLSHHFCLPVPSAADSLRQPHSGAALDDLGVRRKLGMLSVPHTNTLSSSLPPLRSLTRSSSMYTCMLSLPVYI